MAEHETQASISAWQDATFGAAISSARVATRINEEMAELLKWVTIDDTHPNAVEEMADILITMYRLAARFGVDLHAEVDKKMSINRQRAWELDGSGNGQHIRERS